MFVFREEYYLDKNEPSQKENESQSFYVLQMADRRSAAEGKAEIIISKQRHGPTGGIQVQFEAKLTRFGSSPK